MIVDEHNMVRRGLATFLRVVPDLELVGQATNGEEAVRMCERILPDVILMDLLMPVMNGIEATRIIHERWPEVQVIALTSFQEKELVREVIEAGAIGYLLKNVSVEELAQAIRAAHAGRSTLAPEAVQALAHANGQTSSPGHDLAPADREVLNLMVHGLSNTGIADRLGLSPSATKASTERILIALGVSDRAQATTMAIRLKLVG